MPPLPNTSAAGGARLVATGVEGSVEVAAFTFGLLKTGDKKPAAKERIQDTKGRDLSPLPDFCQSCVKNGPEG